MTARKGGVPEDVTIISAVFAEFLSASGEHLLYLRPYGWGRRTPGISGRGGRGRENSSTPGTPARATSASHSRSASAPVGGAERTGPRKPTGGSWSSTIAGVPTIPPAAAKASAMDWRIGSPKGTTSAAAAYEGASPAATRAPSSSTNGGPPALTAANILG